METLAEALPEASLPALVQDRPSPSQKAAADEPPSLLLAAHTPKPSTVEIADDGAAGSELEPPPVYRTTIPPAITLNYAMSRGMLSGVGELQWRPTAAGYEAKLQGSVAGFTILTWVSQGGFDAAGLAPQRFTDQRRGKAARAANFQREAGKITFSGPPDEYPLLPGAQDRLSWMLQVAAIAEGEPSQLATGKRVSMLVAGSRGDADVWSFQVKGPDDVSMGSKTLRAIKLVREPRKQHDTHVEVWLDPAQHHMPIRARLTSDGDTLEFLLQTVRPNS